MPRVLVGLGIVIVLASGCGGTAPQGTDGSVRPDGSDAAILPDGTGGTDGGSEDGTTIPDGSGTDGATTPDSGCQNDPGCEEAGPLCDPEGSNKIGQCVDVGGCLKLQNLADCPSELQTCPAGERACRCPDSSCTSEVDTACGTDGTVVLCQLDTVGGCGVYPESGGQICPSHQSCQGDPGHAGCACDPSECTGAGTVCGSDPTRVVTCALDGQCPYVAGTETCQSPKVCQGDFPDAACACPPAGVGTGLEMGCETLGEKACDPQTGNINECVIDLLSGCQVWRLAQGGDCTASGFVCGTQSGVPACECPPNTTGIFHVDGWNGSAAGSLPFPTGVLEPAVCRFQRITPALARANAWVGAHPAAEVRLTGPSPWSSPLRRSRSSSRTT